MPEFVGGRHQLETGIALDRQIVRFLESSGQVSVRRLAAKTGHSQQSPEFTASIERLMRGLSKDKDLPRLEYAGKRKKNIQIKRYS